MITEPTLLVSSWTFLLYYGSSKDLTEDISGKVKIKEALETNNLLYIGERGVYKNCASVYRNVFGKDTGIQKHLLFFQHSIYKNQDHSKSPIFLFIHGVTVKGYAFTTSVCFFYLHTIVLLKIEKTEEKQQLDDNR